MACFETVSLCLYILERGFTLFSRLLIATDLFGNHEKPASFPIIMITFAAAVQHPGASYRLSGETKPILFSLNRKVGFHPTFLTLDIAQTSLTLFSLNRKVAIKDGGR